jgi:uncharacterized protein (TIGR04255 family)
MAVLEKLHAPPIWEVVCGVCFEPIPELDPFLFGLYWKSIQDRFPNREIKPAVSDQLLIPAPPADHLVILERGVVERKLRGMFVSTDEAFVHQVQHDRFYVNWRKTNPDAKYPRFSDHDGVPGLSAEVQSRFREFVSFILKETARAVTPFRIELTKIDLLFQGTHWQDPQDLGQMMPALAPFLAEQVGRPVLSVHFEERIAGGVVMTTVDALEPTTPGPPLLKLETRVQETVGSQAQLQERFLEANEKANSVFGRLIPREQRERRFSGKAEP